MKSEIKILGLAIQVQRFLVMSLGELSAFLSKKRRFEIEDRTKKKKKKEDFYIFIFDGLM